jgi:glycosyltransferase involved in cell wall biosynthesis
MVVSSSSAWAHAARHSPDAVHVSYCHNPFRYLWNEYERTLAERRDPITRSALRDVFRRWRAWDLAASRRVDAYVTNSVATQERIRRCYRRESTVVYPPVDTARFTPEPPGDHYLVLSELVSHKRIDTIVRAFSELGLPLVVAGDGPHAGHLRRLAASNVSFAGRVSDQDAGALLTSCRALVVAANEEFGIAAVEAQAAGRPVIARAAGGLIETVRDGVTGVLLERRCRRPRARGRRVRRPGDSDVRLRRKRGPLRLQRVPRRVPRSGSACNRARASGAGR